MTQADPEDPLKEQYGDMELVQSKTSATKQYTRVEDLSIEMKGQRVRLAKDHSHLDQHTMMFEVHSLQVLIRSRIHNVRGKGKSAFLVLRQRTDTVQVRGVP